MIILNKLDQFWFLYKTSHRIEQNRHNLLSMQNVSWILRIDFDR